MANRQEPYSSDIHCVFVETNLETRLTLLVHNDENTSDFKEKLCKEHIQVFPDFGEINILAFKVKRQGHFYHLSDSMNVYKAFEGVDKNWFMYVDAVRVHQNEKNKQIAVDSVLVNSLETKVDEKTTRKRKTESSDGKKSRKKLSVGVVSQSGNVEVEVALQSREDVLMGAIGKEDLGEAGTTAELVKIDQKKDLLLASELADGQITLRDGERGEGRRLAPSAVDNLQTAEMVTHAENKLEASSGLTTGPATEKKRKRTKSSKDQSTAAASKDQSTAVSERETLVQVEAIQKETEMGDQFVEKVGSREATIIGAVDNLQVAILQVADGQITLRDGERGEGSRMAPSAVDNIQTAEMVTHAENKLEASSGLTTGPATEKKRKRTRRSKDQSTAAASSTPKEIENEIKEVPGSVDFVDGTSKSCPVSERETLVQVEAMQKETEMGDQFIEKVGSREATIVGADKIQAVDNLQVAGLVSNPHALVQEFKTVDDTTRQLMDENVSLGQEVTKEKVETDANQAKSVKSSKKKSSKKPKTPAKEDTLVASGVQNVEPVKVVDVIRNVLDSLQPRNETEENLAESGKKSSKRSKTKHSLNVVESQVMSVEAVSNATQEDGHHINNPKDTDASFMPAKKDTEVVDHSDASVKGVVNNKKEAVKKSSTSASVSKSKKNVNNKKEDVKKSSNSVTVRQGNNLA